MTPLLPSSVVGVLVVSDTFRTHTGMSLFYHSYVPDKSICQIKRYVISG